MNILFIFFALAEPNLMEYDPYHDPYAIAILFLSDINEVHGSRVLCARRSSTFNFVMETNHEKKCPTIGLLKLRGLRAAAISLIAIEDFVIAEGFGQIYSLFNL
jgi:hypothetical protein